MALTPKKVSEETDYLSADVSLPNAKEDGTFVSRWTGSAYESRFAKSAVLKEILNTPLYIKYSANDAEIRSGLTSPFEVVPDPPVTYAIVPLSMVIRNDFNSVAFNGVSGYASLYTKTGSVKHFQSDSQIIKATSDKFEQAHHQAGDIPEIIAGKGLEIRLSHDHAAGNGTVHFYITYQIIEV